MSAPTIADKQAEIVEEFEFLGDWTERYRHIIELGRELPTIDDERKTDAFKVKGCQSQVWLDADLDGDRVQYVADSDAHIVRGLIALLLRAFNGHPPQEILASGTGFIDQLGLAQNLSQNRANGVRSVMEAIRRHATRLQTRLEEAR